MTTLDLVHNRSVRQLETIKKHRKSRRNLCKSIKNIIEEDMRAQNLMEKGTGLGHFITVKEANMLEIGNKTKCMGKVFCIIPINK